MMHGYGFSANDYRYCFKLFIVLAKLGISARRVTETYNDSTNVWTTRTGIVLKR